MNVKIKLLLFLLLVFITGCHPLYGLIESDFDIAADSRLPVWLKIPDGYSRENVTINITFYSHPFIDKVKVVTFESSQQSKVLSEKICNKEYHPTTKNQAQGVYPRYLVITCEGVPEIFELRKMESVIRVADEPKQGSNNKNI